MAGILKQTGFAFQMIGIVFLEGQARIESKAHKKIVTGHTSHNYDFHY